MTDSLTFGPVHLTVTNLERALPFWRDVLGLRVRAEGEAVELGTDTDTLVVLHGGATRSWSPGFTGLYHLAIHLPDEAEYARVLARLLAFRWPIAPTDHVMSKAIYLDDYDGIGIELTLETPERMRSMGFDADGMPEVIDAEGRRRSGREPLDLQEILDKLPDEDILRPMPAGTKIGHIHLHVRDLREAADFYRDTLGLIEHTYSEQIGMADFHAGGRFPHRFAINTWQGVGAPPAPEGMAGLRHFEVRLADANASPAVAGPIHDPSGNALTVTR